MTLEINIIREDPLMENSSIRSCKIYLNAFLQFLGIHATHVPVRYF